MGKILCIGEALIDMICTDKGSPLSKGDHFLKKAGGAPANVAAAICALGGHADMASKVGTDPFGRHIVDLLHEMGVGTAHIVCTPEHFTTFAFVSLMENGERDFYFNRGADGHLSPADIRPIKLTDYSIVHFGSATAFLGGALQETYMHLLQQAHKSKVFVSFDPNYRELLFGKQQSAFTRQSWTWLKACNFFKVSDEEALLLTGAQTVESAAERFLKDTQATFAITLGPKGTLLGINGTTQIIESIPVNPVDTTGAGDAFVGAMLYQLDQLGATALNLPNPQAWQQMVMNANKAGARTCLYMGAMEALRELNKGVWD